MLVQLVEFSTMWKRSLEQEGNRNLISAFWIRLSAHLPARSGNVFGVQLMGRYRLGGSWCSQPFHARQREEKGGMLEDMFHGARLGSVFGDQAENSLLTDREGLVSEQ